MRFLNIGLLIAGAYLFTGCIPKLPEIQQPVQQVEKNTTSAPKSTLWKDTRPAKEHYPIKPEPYSLESGQKDPELLGPQSTVSRPLASSDAVQATPPGVASAGTVPPAPETQEETFLPKEEPASQPAAATATMTKDKCIALIGQEKYDEYTEKYGSETAALRKCLILQRLHR